MVAYITELNPNTYESFINRNFTLVDLYSDWCQPCKVISIFIDEISSEYVGKLSVGKLNIDLASEIVKELSIRNIPTLVLYKNGKVIDKRTGSISKKQISEMIDKHLSQ